MSEPSVAVARYLPTTAAEGPGVRTAIWVQGADPLRGLLQPTHLFPAEGGTRWPAAALAERVLAEATTG